jgi:hypothetical protein
MMDEAKPNAKAFDKYIEYQVQFAIEGRQKAAEEFSSSSRWLSASLFGINGGAIACVLQIEKFDPIILKNACLSFLIGIVSCFALVTLVQYVVQRKHQFFNARGDRLVRLLDPKVPLDTGHDQEATELNTLRRLDVLWQIVAAISLTSFLVGCWIASYGL